MRLLAGPGAPLGGGLLREWAAFLSPQLDWNWTGFGSWLDRLRGAGLTGNVVPFVGHGTLRIAAMGFERRPPTQDEARRMDALARRGARRGRVRDVDGAHLRARASTQTRRS